MGKYAMESIISRNVLHNGSITQKRVFLESKPKMAPGHVRGNNSAFETVITA